jgi:hypothetical protein
MNFFTKYICLIIENLRISLAKYEARQRHRQTGKRYWVIRNQGKYIVVSRADIKGTKVHIEKLLDHAIFRIG